MTNRSEQRYCPGKPVPGVRRIAVVRDDRLGDVVLTLPAIDALRRTYPDAELVAVVAPSLAELVARTAGVDRVCEATFDLRDAVERLRALAPDLLVCISRSPVQALAAWRAGIAQRVGPGRRWYSRAFNRRVEVSRRAGGRHEVEYALDFAHRAGACAAPARFPLDLRGEDRAAAERTLAALPRGAPFVVLHPGRGGSCPGWPVECFMDLAAGLLGAGIGVVLSIGPADEVEARAFGGRNELAGRITTLRDPLPVLAAILERAAAVVASSTGPLHLAAAVGSSTLALHAPWPGCAPERWGPYADRGWALVAEAPEVRRWSKRLRRARAPELMAGLTPALVRDVVLKLVTGRTPAV